MKPYTIPLRSAAGADRSLCGGKAASLAALIEGGLRVPAGFCVTTAAYGRFIETNGLRSRILLELGRKRLEDMRWEEMWDAALRIRNLFLRTDIPGDVRDAVAAAVGGLPAGVPLAVRSASPAEDRSETSYAGLHESFLNVRGEDEIVRHVKLVWASLWSDAALSYSRELSLEIGSSAMAVIVQKMIFGDRSGVAFGVDPRSKKRAVIEAVYGLNKGLVDGDIEPDRWILERGTGKILEETTATHEEYVVPGSKGVRVDRLGAELLEKPVLARSDISKVFSALSSAERIFGAPQDIEWTIRGRTLFVLQSRPITTVQAGSAGDRRSYDLSLRRSFANLKELAVRIDHRLVPAMIDEAEEISLVELENTSDLQLAAEIGHRRDALERWRGVYWDEFIPFAHGVRLFGQVYNDRVQPEDPFEFVDLISSASSMSIERNRKLECIARRTRAAAPMSGGEAERAWKEIDRRLERLIEEFSGLSCSFAACDDEKQSLREIIEEMAKGPQKRKRKAAGGRKDLLEKYYAAFEDEEQVYADELLELARKSYRLRDDDNIYLGRFESNLIRALEESRRRLGERCRDEYACANPEEVIRALRFPSYTPKKAAASRKRTTEPHARARQVKGQPASAGIARGKAHVITNSKDLFLVRRGEIIVCDAIDPNMTFVVPLAAGIVERRGGMLIHGAIIAREYGIPCVTGVPDATTRIRTGDTLTVDGYFGLVIIHSGEGDIPARGRSRT